MSAFLHSLLLLFLLVDPTYAAGEPFLQARFDTLQREGRPVLVWIHADWCPTCKAQGKVLDALLPAKDLPGLNVLRVDFDSQKPVVRSFRAVSQSTFILFKGGREVARSLGDTDRASIGAFLRRAY